MSRRQSSCKPWVRRQPLPGCSLPTPARVPRRDAESTSIALPPPRLRYQRPGDARHCQPGRQAEEGVGRNQGGSYPTGANARGVSARMRKSPPPRHSTCKQQSESGTDPGRRHPSPSLPRSRGRPPGARRRWNRPCLVARRIAAAGRPDSADSTLQAMAHSDTGRLAASPSGRGLGWAVGGGSAKLAAGMLHLGQCWAVMEVSGSPFCSAFRPGVLSSRVSYRARASCHVTTD
jgi:hypothetical protein